MILVNGSFSGPPLLHNFRRKTVSHFSRTNQISLYSVFHSFDKRELFDFSVINFVNFAENFWLTMFAKNKRVQKSLPCVFACKVLIILD